MGEEQPAERFVLAVAGVAVALGTKFVFALVAEVVVEVEIAGALTTAVVGCCLVTHSSQYRILPLAAERRVPH